MRLSLLKMLAVFALSAAVPAMLPAADEKKAPRPQPVDGPTVDESPAAERTGPLVWHKDLASAIQESRERKSPILVRVSAEWCGWCRRLDREIEKPEVQRALAQWVLVELDADTDQDEVRRLSVGPIPALRVVDSGGRAIRSHDGFLAAKPLVDWLRRASDPAAAGDDGAFVEVPELTAESLPQIIKLLGHRDPELREEASRRLAENKGIAVVAVTMAFRRGNLATQLSALEILTRWKAPIVDLDPWDPNTLTTARLDELEKWVTTTNDH